MALSWLFPSDALAPLVARAQAGEEQAFAGLYDALYPRVWAFVVRRTRTREDAEDVTSRTFHRLLEKLAQVDVRRGGPLPFALAIARNLLIDDLRAQRTGLSLEEAGASLVESRDPLGELLREEELRRLRAAVDRQPPEVRELLTLRFADGLGHGEIAALLGVNEAAVRQRTSRALRALKQELSSPSTEEVVHEP